MRSARPTGPVPGGRPHDSLGEKLSDPRPPGQAGQPEKALIPRVHDRRYAVPLGKDGKDDLLGPGHARRSPQGPHYRGLQPPQVGLRHRRHGHPMEGQRCDQGADGLLLPVIGREVGEATQGAPPRLHAPGQYRTRGLGAPNGDVHAELAEGRHQRDGGPPDQHRQGALFPLDPGARLVHADVLPCDPQPLLRRGDCRREAAPRATAWVSSA